MSSSARLPVSAFLHDVLDEVLAVDPIYLTTAEKQAVLRALPQVIARAEAAMLRVLAVADDIAIETGARSTAAWLADQTRQAHGTVRRHSALAGALAYGGSRPPVRSPPALNLAQARVIAEALDALPKELGDDLGPRRRPIWSRRPPSSGRASCGCWAAAYWSTSPPRSPTTPSTNACSPPNAARVRPPDCPAAAQ